MELYQGSPGPTGVTVIQAPAEYVFTAFGEAVAAGLRQDKIQNLATNVPVFSFTCSRTASSSVVLRGALPPQGIPASLGPAAAAAQPDPDPHTPVPRRPIVGSPEESVCQYKGEAQALMRDVEIEARIAANLRE
jgi:hypothetical protein